tara:strand:- start:145 stop:342 length:198 start_codon:yes stop_codon:yes gene_type:complete
METRLQKSYEDPEKKTIYNYYHDYFTAKKKVRYNPTNKDYLKILSPRYSLTESETGVDVDFEFVD